METVISETDTQWAQISGPKGSNEGGWFNKDGQNYYVKFYRDENRARVEFLANRIYEEAGISVPQTSLETMGNRLAIVSKEIPGARRLSSREMAQMPDVLRGFIVDTFLGNRDVTGSAFDNIFESSDGKCYRVDNGGSLIYRARGGIKDYPAGEIVEIDTMRDPVFPAGTVYSTLSDTELREQAEKLLANLSPTKIDRLVDSAGLDKKTSDNLKTSLKGRLKYLSKRFGSTEQSLDMETIGNPRILAVWSEADVERINSAQFQEKQSRGIELRQNEAILIRIPEVLSERLLDSITIHHRKSEKYRDSIREDGWDSEGAYTQILVWDKEMKTWYGWGSPLGEPKFAEPRPASNPEAEILYDWIAYSGEIKPEYVLVIGDGRGELGVVNLHGLEIETFPENPSPKIEIVFSKGTQFVDPRRGVLTPTYGGGERPRMGIYPNSVPLNHPGTSSLDFPITLKGAGIVLQQDGYGRTGDLSLIIDRDIPLERIEVAIGDTEDMKGKVYKREEPFRRGWAKLDVFIDKGFGRKEALITRANVPPRGILKGSPREKTILKKGDKIVFRSINDASYVMGIRIQ